MGTWGEKTFENDATMDWVYELEEARDTSLIARTLGGVSGSSEVYLDASDCAMALAAAEVVAAGNGRPGPDLPDEVRSWVGEHRIETDGEPSGLAVQAVARVKNGPGSELKDLWDESGDTSGWYGAVDDLRARLDP